MKTTKLHAEVRFHLLNGPNYKHWQVKIMQGKKKVDEYYYNPNKYQLEIINCTLVNQLARARWVNKKQKKNVSGWVKCDEVIVNNISQANVPVGSLEKLYYNPIVDVHWRRESDDREFKWDNSEYATLVTDNRQVYVLEERV